MTGECLNIKIFQNMKNLSRSIKLKYLIPKIINPKKTPKRLLD